MVCVGFCVHLCGLNVKPEQSFCCCDHRWFHYCVLGAASRPAKCIDSFTEPDLFVQIFRVRGSQQLCRGAGLPCACSLTSKPRAQALGLAAGTPNLASGALCPEALPLALGSKASGWCWHRTGARLPGLAVETPLAADFSWRSRPRLRKRLPSRHRQVLCPGRWPPLLDHLSPR